MRRTGFLAALCLSTALASLPAVAAEQAMQAVDIGWLTKERDLPPVLSNLDDIPADKGVAGARLGISDNDTTGRFMGHDYTLTEVVVPLEGDVADGFRQLRESGHRLIVTDLTAEELKQVAALPEAADTLIFNAGAPDDALRQSACLANVLHTLPSRAMLADALAQFLVKKRWREWFLVIGPAEGDKAFAAAVRRAAARFGAEIVAEKEWQWDHDIRRTAHEEIPLVTQEVDYQMLIVADERGDFGEYTPYNTWEPTLVAGTQGLVPTAWHRVVEQWGAVQLQNRFEEMADRPMGPEDYAAWAAVRSVGEAVTRQNTVAFEPIDAFIRSDAFELAGFKGRKLTYRPWNGQLRQPIPLAAPRALVALAPMEGFLHQTTELDTLGYDAPEVDCDR
ncbi:ABC transporter substrate-binding protein [Caenispirillum salinarum]|uniref:ABC transporter substrate-binding protein n=1 Tax=Caenispirillum salinarum TaxID=859058 RepID=UPI00384DFE4D